MPHATAEKNISYLDFEAEHTTDGTRTLRTWECSEVEAQNFQN